VINKSETDTLPTPCETSSSYYTTLWIIMLSCIRWQFGYDKEYWYRVAPTDVSNKYV